MDGIPVFDEIHVISDIHMGGHEGFQIFRETGCLARFIGWVAQRPADRVALVLNGRRTPVITVPTYTMDLPD